MLLCAGCIAIAVPLGCLLGILLLRTNIIGRKLLLIAFVSQLPIPLYVIAGSWNAGFGLQGWWPLAQTTALRYESMSFIAALFIHAIALIPWIGLITGCGLTWSPRSLEESALSEAGVGAVIRRVMLPALRPWMGLACIWCCVPILTEMVVTNLYQVRTVAELIYLDASRGTVSGLTYPAAVLLCILPVVICLVVAGRRLPPWSELISRAVQHPPRVLSLGAARIPLSLFSWCVGLAVVGLPVANLIVKAGWQPYVDETQVTRYGWAATRFALTVKESILLYLNEFYWSAVLAVTAATLAIAVAIGLAAITRPGWRRWCVHAVMLILLGTPGAMVGTTLIYLLNRSEPALFGWLYDHTLTAPILAQQFRLLPLAWLFTLSILATIDRRSLELVQLEGLSFLQRFKTILWPQTGRRWIVAWLMLMLLSVGELSTTILLLPSGVTTLAMRLFEMLHFGMRHQDSGLCLLLIFLGWLAGLSAWKTLIDRKTEAS